ncbi:hypothetical protein AB0M57_04290 [Streptomyces sp. NPDC051597]|uniref:hypothetical protein n=1 Tax=Streptomyces sp. NPDC051597 TaxID=3155049 RepID=UPI0034356E09
MSAQARLEILRSAVAEQPSRRWTSRVVQRLYQQHGHDVPHQRTAKNDLALLARQGLLLVCGPENGRYYLMRRLSGGAR